MKNKKILFHLLWIFISVLFVAGIGTALARYVITKTVYVTISTNATETTGTVDYTITNEKDIYTVSDEAETIGIKSSVKLENADNISTNAYYAWTTLNEEPTTDDYKSFTFDSNEYTIAKADTAVGTYKLWVKVIYTSEVGEEKEVIKKSDAIKVVLGTINISLEDETSDYLAGSVTANITYKGEYCENAVVGYGKTEEEAESNAKEVILTSKATTLTIETTDSATYYIYAYGEDTDGNSISAVRKIENIDNEKPTIDSITASYTRVKLNLSDNKSGVKYYTATITNEEPTTYSYTLDTALTSVEDKYIEGLSTNTKYYIWVKDVAGNVTSQSITTKSVSYTVSPSGWTQSKTVKFSDLDNCTLTYTIGSDTETILSYSETDGITLTENTTINYTLQDGENTVTGTINVTNIDTTSPTVEATSDYEKITLTANDTESSVSGYIVTDTEITNIEGATFTSVNSTTSLSEEITQDYLGNSLKYDTTYYIYVKDVAGNITEAEVISKVDNIAPTLELGSTSSTTNSVKVTVNATDDESGIDTYTYYLSSTEDDFTGSEAIVSNDNSYTFEGLEDNAKWYVKVIATDKAGNTSSETETSIQTGELLIDEENTTVTFSDALWSSNEQTVTVTTSTGCKIKYQIVSQEGAISDNGWSDPIASGTQVTGLKNGDTLYVKIYDGINTSNNYATYSVKNEMAENCSTITEEEMSKISEGEYDILTYSVNTSVATVSANKENESAKTYNYYIKNITSDTYELKMTSSSYDENVKIEEETEGQTYEIVLVELANDTEGTLSRCKNTSIVISREEATAGNSYSDNRSYTDSQNYVATVPAGFSVSSTEGENVISSGLVLKDTSGNEYVWVPVNDTISGKDTDTSLITADSENLDELGFSSTESFKSYLETEYSNIKDSVNTYKGFYVGRYETTTDSGTVGSKSGASILNGNWYTLYRYQNSSLYSNNSLNSSTAVSSTMIYGAEYDAMLTWMKTGEDSEKVTTSGLGNTTGAISTAGQYANDKINNIYDLSSNAYDLTVESSSDSRVYRGGGYNSSDAKSASDSSTISSTESGDIIGSRMALYILGEGDTVAPTISLTLDPAGTRITAKVTATDVGTGVKNYYYSISSDGETWSEDTVSADNTHTFTELSTKTTYYIRVKAVDKAGNSCEYVQASCTTDIIDVADDAITVHRIYGKDGEGIALLDLDDDYSSYYIEYQVVKKADAEAGKGVDVNGTWTQGDSVTGLSVATLYMQE